MQVSELIELEKYEGGLKLASNWVLMFKDFNLTSFFHFLKNSKKVLMWRKECSKRNV